MARVSGASGYTYGWPSGGTLEPDVAAQWLFDESSGNIVDEVGGVTMEPVGSPTYSDNSLTGAWSNLNPGINMSNDTYFRKPSATSALDLGTDDFVVEWVGSSVDITTNEYIFASQTDATSEGFRFGQHNHADLITGGLYNAGGTQVSFNIATPAGTDFSDGTPYKVRIVGDRSGNMAVYVNGEIGGTVSISSLSALSLNSTDASVNYNPGVGSGHHKLYEVRLTVGNLTNNSGGPNGG